MRTRHKDPLAPRHEICNPKQKRDTSRSPPHAQEGPRTRIAPLSTCIHCFYTTQVNYSATAFPKSFHTPRIDRTNESSNANATAFHITMAAQDDATVLFLFMAFGSLIILLLILVAVGVQTWFLWKIARTVVEGKGVVVEKSLIALDGEVLGDDVKLSRRKSRIESQESHI